MITMLISTATMGSVDFNRYLLAASKLCFILLCLPPSIYTFTDCQSANDCCACVKRPGCSWFYSSSLAQPFCSDSPLDGQVVNETLEVRTPHSPKIFIQRNVPINFSRRRLITPQVIRLKGNLGISESLPFQVMSRSRNVNLRIVGPRDDVKLDVFTEYTWTCEGGLRRDRSLRAGGRRRGRSRKQRFGVGCMTSAPGETSGFVLRITVARCFQRSKVVKVRVRTSGERSIPLRVHVESNCACPAEEFSRFTHDSNSTDNDDVEELPHTCYISASEVDLLDETCMNSVLSGSCQLTNGPLCSSHGVCLCGQCACFFVGISPLQRYTGRYCDCDNTHCPISYDGTMCGGEERGRCQCGVCQCRPGWTGPTCDCSDNPEQCIRDKNGRECSNNGQCICGTCRCNDGYSGLACECRNTNCPLSSYNGLVCGGTERGVCQCGQCLCIGPRIGDACDQEVTGIPISSSSMPCSGRGYLKHGVCVCEAPYTGDQCQDCPTCSSTCNNYQTCVGCHALQFLSSTTQCSDCENSEIHYRVVDHLPDTGSLCVIRYHSCRVEFTYEIAQNGTTVVSYNTNIMISHGIRSSGQAISDCN